MPSHIPEPLLNPLLSSFSATCVDQRGSCAGFWSTSLLRVLLVSPLSLLSYVASRIAFIFLTLIQPSLDPHKCPQDEFWWIDFRFEDFADLFLWWDYLWDSYLCLGLGSVSLICLEVIVMARGNAQQGRLCPFCHRRSSLWGHTTGNNHVQMLSQNRKKTHKMLLIFFSFFFFFLLSWWFLIHDDTWWMFQ